MSSGSAVSPPQSAPAIRLLVCVGPRCDQVGKGRELLEKLMAALDAEFPEDLRDGRISCAPRDCLRHCTQEPIVRAEPSGDAFSNPTIDELLRLVDEALRT